MARPTKTPGHPLANVVKVRLSDVDITALDLARAGIDRSTWIRTAILLAIDPDHTDLAADTLRATQLPHGEVQPQDPVEKHRHIPGELLSEVGLKGVTTATYRCAHPGCNHELRRQR